MQTQRRTIPTWITVWIHTKKHAQNSCSRKPADSWKLANFGNLEYRIQEFQIILFAFNREHQNVVISTSPLTEDENFERQEEPTFSEEEPPARDISTATQLEEPRTLQSTPERLQVSCPCSMEVPVVAIHASTCGLVDTRSRPNEVGNVT